MKRAYLFGSRVRGDHRAESDIDIALELDPAVFRGVDDSDGLATWIFETNGWKDELEKLIPLKVQLERYHPDRTPTVKKGLTQSSQLVYEKATNLTLNNRKRTTVFLNSPHQTKKVSCLLPRFSMDFAGQFDYHVALVVRSTEFTNWRVSPHCRVVNLVRSGRKQPQLYMQVPGVRLASLLG